MNRSLVAGILCRTGLRQLIETASRWSGVVALNYHRIGDGSKSPFDRALWSADEESFTSHLRFLKSHMDLITADDLPDVLGKKSGRYGMITFDDGYRDNFDTAYSILRAEGARATFFLTSGFISTTTVPYWDEIAWMLRSSPLDSVEAPGWLPSKLMYDEPNRDVAIAAVLREFKKVPPENANRFLAAIGVATRSDRCQNADLWMTWDMVRTMRKAGMALGGHSVGHPVLSLSDPARQTHEIVGSVERIAQELGEPVISFSYPFGGRRAFNQVSVDVLREAGIRYAFSYYGGFRRFDDWFDYDVRRVPIEPEVTRDWFRCLVTIPGTFARR